MDKRMGTTLALVVALGLGAAAALVADQLYWASNLKVQMAEKERVIAGLQADLDDLRAGLDRLKGTNDAMRALIDSSLKDSADVARSNKTSVEKLRGIIARLEALRASLEATP